MTRPVKRKNNSTNTNSILIIGGHDPSGAGLQADIETSVVNGCHSVSALTCITAQNTSSVDFVKPISSQEFSSKINSILIDFKPSVIKIGLVPSFELCEEIHLFISGLNYETKIVVDPIIWSGSGKPLIEKTQTTGLQKFLMPNATLLTPNRFELLKLTQTNDLTSSLESLFKHGVKNILATDIFNNKKIITNAYASTGTDKIVYYSVPRISGDFHGSGCTLATAIACGMAKNKNIEQSILDAQHFTNTAVLNAYDFGLFQKLPNRSVQVKR